MILRAVPTLILLLVAGVLVLPVLSVLGSWSQWDAATAGILREMGFASVRLMTNNPEKVARLE